MAEVNLTGGGEQFLLLQATSPDTHILLDCRHDVATLCIQYLFFFFGFAGRKFHPYIGNRRIAGTNRSLDNGPAGVIAYENISYIMLICMSAFLVAVVRTPLTAIVLITEITDIWKSFIHLLSWGIDLLFHGDAPDKTLQCDFYMMI